MEKATWHVVYLNFSGEQRELDIEVKMHGASFYAQNLQTLGCGKSAMSPLWAIKTLVNDHGQFVSAAPNL